MRRESGYGRARGGRSAEGRRRAPGVLAGVCAALAALAALASGAPVVLAQSGAPAPGSAAPAAPPATPKKLVADPVSARIAEKGLTAVEEELSALASPSPQELFVLAGVRFLRALERASIERHRYDSAEVTFAPVFRLPLPKNPKPEKFDPAMVERVLEGLLEDMAGVEKALDRIPQAALAEETFGVTLGLDDLWIDSNGNGKRDEAGPVTETVMDLAGGALGANMRGMGGTLVRFDAADVAWLRAYAHMLSGVAEMALSLGPTEALKRVQPGWESAEKHRAASSLGLGEDAWIDQAATLLLMTRATPDRDRTRAALAHFDAMIAHNRLFWARVVEEKDDRGEWIPNPSQKSALGGVTVSAEAAQAWIAVLGELEKVLKGELLLGHWRYAANEKGEPVGVNLRKVLEEPSSADIVLWLQGAAATKYLEKGEVASGQSWRAFESLVSGQALTFALWFN